MPKPSNYPPGFDERELDQPEEETPDVEPEYKEEPIE